MNMGGARRLLRAAAAGWWSHLDSDEMGSGGLARTLDRLFSTFSSVSWPRGNLFHMEPDGQWWDKSGPGCLPDRTSLPPRRGCLARQTSVFKKMIGEKKENSQQLPQLEDIRRHSPTSRSHLDHNQLTTTLITCLSDLDIDLLRHF